MSRRLLVVDDDDRVLESLSGALEDDVTVVETAGDARSALKTVKEFGPDVVLTDVRMPGLDGLEFLKMLTERRPSVSVVLMTAYEDMPTVVTAMREGASDFLVKPLDLPELRGVLDRIFEERRLRERERRKREEEASTYRLDALVGRDPEMIRIYKLIGQLADSRVTVLVRGESGTGKELVARAIHYNSPASDEPFVALNCTALTETLLESELFGHVRGAFTGAVESRRGRFALAGRGTIFLDEIGDTSPGFQAKLLRVLEEKTFYPVGAEEPESTEARVIASTHRDLEELVAAGEFREDLYFRLRVVEVVVPPLRDRMGDLPLLTEHLVQRAAEEMHVSPPVVSEETMEALAAHDWPGNVRELDNCLTRAVVLVTGGVIRPEHLGLARETGEPPREVETLAEVEERQVARALAAAEGQKTRAAEILGISRPRLYRLIEKYGLEEG